MRPSTLATAAEGSAAAKVTDCSGVHRLGLPMVTLVLMPVAAYRSAMKAATVDEYRWLVRMCLTPRSARVVMIPAVGWYAA